MAVPIDCIIITIIHSHSHEDLVIKISMVMPLTRTMRASRHTYCRRIRISRFAWMVDSTGWLAGWLAGLLACYRKAHEIVLRRRGWEIVRVRAISGISDTMSHFSLPFNKHNAFSEHSTTSTCFCQASFTNCVCEHNLTREKKSVP